MAAPGDFMDSRIGSDIGPSSDEEDFASTASVTSQKHSMDTEKEEEKTGQCLMVDQPKTKPSVEEDIYSESPSSGQNDTKQAATSTATPGNMNDSQENSDSVDLKILKKPLYLLDLPVEILKEIMKQVTHTNDLTALALSCSRLHAMAIPYMYSRFDIVWPESLPTTDPPGGVDALSYGLATLVMGEDIFHTLPPSNSSVGSCSNCGCHDQTPTTTPGTDIKQRTRRGNYFAQYTRKFSIGNGPAIWVKEYSVNKETGKLLGTLVALAVARMVNLEAFIWDMPTGVLKDVWVALASLADRPGHECRLERVWVRWHNNSRNSMRSVRSTSGSQGISLPATHSSANLPLGAQFLLHKYGHVEYPTLSILPPLKSVSVLNIDEPSYLEELAVLIERSRYRLKELRIGMAHIGGAKWQEPTGDRPFQPNATTTWPKAGGVLEVLSGTSHYISPSELTAQKGNHSVENQTSQHVEQSPMSVDALSTSSAQHQSTTAESSNTSSTQQGAETFNNPEPNDAQGSKDVLQESSKPLEQSGVPDSSKSDVDHHRVQLKLEVLELERVSIFVPAMLWSLDWTKLTTLTVLGCKGHDKLWRVLRRQFAPSMTQQNGTKNTSHGEFRLRIKNLHTDAVSPYLLLFIKDALAPNTLETVFLHESAPYYSSTVSIDGIYRNVLRRHRTSLKRVLVKVLSLNSADIGGRWRKWMFNREVISFVTSGKMPRLRELSMAIDMKDWHFFVQRLPNIPHLRALHISNHNYPNLNNQKELALQILDVITIRPEISLAYVGISDKCYEILECKEKGEDSDNTEDDAPPHESWGESDDDYDDDDDDDDDDDLDDDDAFSDDDNIDGMASENDPSSGEENSSSDGDESASDRDKSQVVFKLREILFYDDKIGIFKSRRGDL